ncbi:MAG TPA: site-specific integrase [Acidimicrobiales bacterium]|jgi:integrase
MGPPKTEASTRTIPVPDAVLGALSAHLAEFRTGQGGPVFTREEGSPSTPGQIRWLWRDAARRAGCPGKSPHDLRHFAASALINEGASVKAVQMFLGHASASVTLDTYAHLWPSDDDRIRVALDRVLAAPVSSSCHVEPARAADLR